MEFHIKIDVFKCTQNLQLTGREALALMWKEEGTIDPATELTAVQASSET